MQEFYRKALVALIVLLVASALVAWFCVNRSYLSASLIPQDRAGAHWRTLTSTDAILGGTSTIRIVDDGRKSLRFDFRLTRAATYSWVAAEMQMEDGQGRAVPADLSRYNTVSFIAKCLPANSLQFGMPTFDASISRPGLTHTYPSPITFFSCSEKGTPVSLDLTRLTIPAWWFQTMKVDPARQSYNLAQVAKFVFGISQHSPREVDSHVEIGELTLHGRDHRYLVGLAAFLVVGWLPFFVWFLWAHSQALVASVDARLKNDLHFSAYRQLTLEPFKDKEKAAILQYMGSHFMDHELDMGSVTARIGASREKINAVLKQELGMTFTGYVNKLRLTEAARLLADANGSPIAEIAHAVGYGNVSYFNKLFKEEYGTTPKVFRSLARQPASSTGRDRVKAADAVIAGTRHE